MQYRLEWGLGGGHVSTMLPSAILKLKNDGVEKPEGSR